jgi:hypothetical protein
MKTVARNSSQRARAGWTLVEMFVATALGVLMLSSLMLVVVFVSQGFAAIGNYGDLDKYSRNALDTMSRDIRTTSTLTSYAPDRISLTNLDGIRFTYAWDGSNVVTRSVVGSTGTTNTLLLTNCDVLTFHIYSRVPGTDFSFTPATTVSTAKLIDVSWRCSREIYGNKINTESVQTAKIVIRN